MNYVDSNLSTDLDKSSADAIATSSSASFWTSGALHIIILLALVACTFARTLTSYFLADDFCEIAYVQEIFRGHPEMFWSNFTGNYMQIPGMSVYRPWLLCSLAIDWLLFGAKAWGYYLTNILYLCGCVIALYAVVRVLTKNFGTIRSSLCALATAALFAASPLHGESTSWVVGRVDIVCAFFYLVGLYCFSVNAISPGAGNKKRTIFGVIAFVFAICTKEMAVGLPVMAAVIAYLWKNENREVPLISMKRLKASVIDTLPLWIVICAYFVVRMVCLKTAVGGYVAGFGAGQLSDLVNHWLDKDTMTRLMVPLHHDLYEGNAPYRGMVWSVFTVTATLASVRLISARISLSWYLFAGAWLATCAAPIFQLWGLAPNLEGARFYFFLTMPLSLILPLLLFYPAKPHAGYANAEDRTNRIVTLAGSVALVALICFYQRAALNTNLLWVRAGKEVAQLSSTCQKMAEASTPNERFIILGIPQDNQGAHMILNGVTFDAMLRPPFADKDFSQKFLNCSPVMYSPNDLINGGQFKKMLGTFDVLGAYVWSRDKRDLIKMDYGQATKGLAQSISLNHGQSQQMSVRAGQALSFELPEISPLDYQYLQFDIEQKGDAQRVGEISWSGTQVIEPDSHKLNSATFILSEHKDYKHFQTETINLGHHWRWYASGKIEALHVTFPVATSCYVKNVRLVPYAVCAPELTIASASPLDHGPSPYMSMVHLRPVTLQLTPTRTPLSSAAKIEISKVNFFYDNFEDQEKVDPVDRSFIVSVASGAPRSIDLAKELKNEPFVSHGFYQVRAQFVDEKGKPLGAASDTVTVNWQ